MTCSSLVDLGTIAENYGQMTGVLAGFAFTALVLLLTPTQSNERLAAGRHGEGVPLSLFVAFIALVIATLMYSVLAGEPEEARSRAATVELIDGLVFALAVLMLLQGLTLLMQGANIERSAVAISRVVTVVVIPALAMYFIAQGASDTVAARDAMNGRPCVASVPVLGIILTAALAAILAACLSPKVQKLAGQRAGTLRVAAPLTVFSVSIIAAVASGHISTRSPAFLMSPEALNLFLVGAFLVLASVGIMLALSDVAETRAVDEVEDDGLVRRDSSPQDG